MERREITAGNFDWNSLLRHVVGDQATVEVSENDVPVARIGPIRRSVLMSEIDAVLAALPSLGTDVDGFAADIERALNELPTEGNPWAS